MIWVGKGVDTKSNTKKKKLGVILVSLSATCRFLANIETNLLHSTMTCPNLYDVVEMILRNQGFFLPIGTCVKIAETNTFRFLDGTF